MANDLEEELQEVEASWPQTKELAFVIDDPLEKLMEKASKIFKGRHHDTLDALAVRIADAIPEGANEQNFEVAEPISGAARKHFSDIEKLRTGLNRPFLDAKKAVDGAAKATVARAEPMLMPIINAVKKIQDKRKREEEARAEAERKRIEDERLAAEKAHRDMIEAEHAADKKRLADQAAADRKQAEDLAAKNRQANDELAELRKQLEKMGRTEVKGTPEIAKAIAAAPIVGKMVAMDDHGYPVLPKATTPDFDDALPLPPMNLELLDPFAPAPDPDQPSDKVGDDFLSAMLDADTSAEFSKAGVEVSASADQQKVRDFGVAVKVFVDSLKRPLLVKAEARQAVELAVFDLYAVANGLQEWRIA